VIPRWFLVTVLASPMLLPLASGVAARPEPQAPKAGQQEAGPARADLFVAPTGRDDNPGTAEKPLARLAGRGTRSGDGRPAAAYGPA
jgi:hypothetical protein